MLLPLPLDPYVYHAQLGRVVDGDTALLHVDQGFGDWKLGSKWPGGPDAKYPQGRYRLNGIDAPEKRGATRAQGIASMERLKELAQLGSLLVRTTKHGKFRYLVDLFVKRPLGDTDFMSHFDESAERKNWLTDEELVQLFAQTSSGVNSTIRALVSEVLWSRSALRGHSNVIHINQALVDEGLARPYDGGKR